MKQFLKWTLWGLALSATIVAALCSKKGLMSRILDVTCALGYASLMDFCMFMPVARNPTDA